MSPTRPCPLCEDDVATHMCFACGYRLCKECMELENGLCPACGGIVWVDVLGSNQPRVLIEDEEEDEDV